ncbi:hypothetical protein [Myxosarcina sp. GI1(2024)]
MNPNTVVRWVEKSAIALPNSPEVEEIPEITEIDELQTHVGTKSGANPRRFPLQGNAHQDKTKSGFGQPSIAGN